MSIFGIIPAWKKLQSWPPTLSSSSIGEGVAEKLDPKEAVEQPVNQRAKGTKKNWSA